MTCMSSNCHRFSQNGDKLGDMGLGEGMGGKEGVEGGVDQLPDVAEEKDEV